MQCPSGLLLGSRASRPAGAAPPLLCSSALVAGRVLAVEHIAMPGWRSR